jgi:hypothetical protein
VSDRSHFTYFLILHPSFFYTYRYPHPRISEDCGFKAIEIPSLHENDSFCHLQGNGLKLILRHPNRQLTYHPAVGHADWH